MSVSSAREVWAVTTYFNPARFASRLRNYRAFRAALGQPLIAIELGYDGVFELTSTDAELVIQIPGRAVLWQKERLLNVALDRLPRSADAVIWLDCDIVFEREDWANVAYKLLDRFHLVQLFDTVVEAKFDERPELGAVAGLISGVSVASSMGHGYRDFSAVVGKPVGPRQCAFGLAWAGHTALLRKHRFYDAMILGGGDRAFACAAYGTHDEYVRTAFLNCRRATHYLRWAQRFFREVRGTVGYVPGRLTHLWHGELLDRRYLQRHADLAKYDLDPELDLELDESGCWRWSSSKPDLHNFAREYFFLRNEDGDPRTTYLQDADC